MNNKIQVTFHNIPHSDTIKELINDKIEKLETRFKKITVCNVRVDKPHNHSHKGTEYKVEATISIPHFTTTGHAHNVYMHTAVSDAIDSAAKRVSKSIDKKRGKRGKDSIK